MIGNIDEPTLHSVTCSSFVCKGWIYSEHGITALKILIDDQDAGFVEYGLLRNDVKAQFPQYFGIEYSGFLLSKDIPLFNGLHRLEVKVYEKNGTVSCFKKTEFLYSKEKEVNPLASDISARSSSQQVDPNLGLLARERISFRYLIGSGIEIGALHNPLPISNSAKVKYIDRMPSTELQKHYAELNPQLMVNIDIIDDGEILSKISDNSLDFVIANHFLEHCENPIGTIRNHIKKIKSRGILYYAIPIKTYTFDKDRPLTKISHLIDDDTNGATNSRNNHYCEWAKFVDKIQTPDEIEQRISQLMTMGYSIHYHVWDIESWFEFLYKTNEYLNNPFKVMHFEHNDNEIITILQKS
jgi:hypothetical protein